MKKIKVEECLSGDFLFVDTRSPSEFLHDHIPGSINMPILDDEERKNVGILYKDDADSAFDLGVEYYSKKLPKLVEAARKLPSGKKIVVYCWRGGMRSKAICQMLDLLKHDVFQLVGGYKAYREHVRESLRNFKPGFRFIVLWGNTGCAKTTIIRKLESAIDLEGLAQHRSSLFGGVGLKPRSQKMFESLLYRDVVMLDKERFVFCEGESRKIGDVEIPASVYKAIRNGIHVRIDADIDTRVKNTVEEYLLLDHLDEIRSIVRKLKQWLSAAKVDEIINMIDSGRYDEAARIMLLDYYDPRYKQVLDSVNYSYEVKSDDIKRCISRLYSIRDSLLS